MLLYTLIYSAALLREPLTCCHAASLRARAAIDTLQQRDASAAVMRDTADGTARYIQCYDAPARVMRCYGGVAAP